MKIRYFIYMLFALVATTACVEEDLINSKGKVVLSIGGVKPLAADSTVQTRTTVTEASTGGEWIDGDLVTTQVTFCGNDGNALLGHTYTIVYEHIEGKWEVKTGDTYIQLPNTIHSIRIEANMVHEYNDNDKVQEKPVRGTETMTASKEITGVSPSGTYTVLIDTWKRTSSLLHVVNLKEGETITVKKGTEQWEATRSTDAYFHLEADAEHMAYVANEGTTKTYRLNAQYLVAGHKFELDLVKRPSENDGFDPDKELPEIPEYPGYLKYEETKDGKTITRYEVINGEGLKNAFEEADISDPNATIVLHNNIDMSQVKDFKPFDGGDNGFQGTFDGGGHTISGLEETTFVDASNFNDDTETVQGGTYQCTGLFAYLGTEGVIKNVTLRNINLAVTAQRSNVDVIVGSIVGINKGLVENCHVIGDPKTEGSKISASGEAGASVDYDTRVGGIVGMNHEGGKVIACSIKGKVSITSIQNHFIMAGGIVAYNFGDVVACYSDANYFNNPDVRNDYTGYIEKQCITIYGETDHKYESSSCGNDGIVDVGGIVAYNESKALNSGGGIVSGRVIACYVNFDHNSALTADNPGGGVARVGMLTSQDSGTHTEHSYWNKGKFDEYTYAIGSDTYTTSNNTSTTHTTIAKVTGGTGYDWPDIISKLNTGITAYGNIGWKYENRYDVTFQPYLYKTN